jgi:tellurite resistance protein TerC
VRLAGLSRIIVILYASVNTSNLFPFTEYWWVYAAFIVFISLVLLLDLGVFHKKAHTVSFKEASIWSVIWVALALIVNYLFYQHALHKLQGQAQLGLFSTAYAEATARRLGLEFFTGYVVEEILSIDNIFLFIIVFNYFNIPSLYYHRVLFYGILGAVVFRGIFISLGAWLVHYEWVMLVFGAFLIFTGVKIVLIPQQKLDPNKVPLAIKLLNKILPITNQLHEQRFFVKLSGIWHATPLLAALVFIEATDVIFALDSVPAIFAITKEPLIVFLSNMLAVLGLRSLFFLLSAAVTAFYYLRHGVGLILIFIGSKMTILKELFHDQLPITASLAVIGVILASCILLSMLKSRKNKFLQAQI